jgi:putative ABC transport system permease protein
MTLAGGVCALIGIALWIWLSRQPAGEGLLAGFALVAMLLLTSALWLPPMLAVVLALGRLIRHKPLAQWALADLQLQLPRLALAMMALMIALSANLGVSSMVGGFRLTFLDWLDQRLMADLYLRPPPAQFDEIDSWLATRPEVDERLATRSADATLVSVNARTLDLAVGVFGITPGERLKPSWPLLETREGRDSAWQALAGGEAFVNEQLAIGQGIAPGDNLTLTTPDGTASLEVAAVYPDYGNPRGEVLLATSQLAERFAAPPGSLGIVLAENTDETALRQTLFERFDLGRDALQDQREVKRIATGIFERTFSITRALNALTLGVAALALLASLLAQARQRRRQLAPLWALGVPRSRLVQVQLAQLGGVALITGMLAIPLGIAITWGLVAVINVAAFGWRLPLHVFPAEIGLTLATAVTVALLAAALPAITLWRTPPRALLAEEEGA